LAALIHFQTTPEYLHDFSETLVRLIAEKTLDYLGIPLCELSVVIETDAEIQGLNRQYRHIDSTTDVLSFLYNNFDPETNRRYLGDIVLSGKKIYDQAKEMGHSPQWELCLLIVHGILHLAGYDHEEERDAAMMLTLQEKIIHLVELK